MIITDYTNPNVRVIDDFITPEDSKKILANIKQIPEQTWSHLNVNADSGISMAWNDMTILYQRDYNTEDLQNISNRITEQMIDYFKMDMLIKHSTLNRWRKGRKQSPHIDFFHEEDDHDYEDMQKYGHTKESSLEFGKTFNSYHFSCLLYFNGHEDFEGGDLYFPQFDNFVLEPKAGRLAMFIGDTKHYHGVTEVTDGIRYTISSFYTDPTKQRSNIIP